MSNPCSNCSYARVPSDKPPCVQCISQTLLYSGTMGVLGSEKPCFVEKIMGHRTLAV